MAHDSEAPAKSVFLAGYSVGPLKGVLEKLLGSCGVPAGKVKPLAAEIISLAVKPGSELSEAFGHKVGAGLLGHPRWQEVQVPSSDKEMPQIFQGPAALATCCRSF